MKSSLATKLLRIKPGSPKKYLDPTDRPKEHFQLNQSQLPVKTLYLKVSCNFSALRVGALLCSSCKFVLKRGFGNRVYYRVDQLRHQPSIGWRFLPYGLTRTRNFSHTLAKAMLPSNITWKLREKCASERVKPR